MTSFRYNTETDHFEEFCLFKEVEILKRELNILREENRELKKLLKEASFPEMGGYPDLFCPERGWDEWYELVDEAIKDLKDE
jgi:hypothetical protein